MCVCACACVRWESTEEERNFSFNFPQLQILHPRALCFYWNGEQKTPSVYEALKRGGELEGGTVNLYIWLCLSPSRINPFTADFGCSTKERRFLARNHVYHGRQKAGENTLVGGERGGREGEMEAGLWREGGTCVVGRGVILGLKAQEEGIIVHYPNGRWNKRMGEETALHSINSAFVVRQLLMMYEGERCAALQDNTCSVLVLRGSADGLRTWRRISWL